MLIQHTHQSDHTQASTDYLFICGVMVLSAIVQSIGTTTGAVAFATTALLIYAFSKPKSPVSLFFKAAGAMGVATLLMQSCLYWCGPMGILVILFLMAGAARGLSYDIFKH